MFVVIAMKKKNRNMKMNHTYENEENMYESFRLSDVQFRKLQIRSDPDTFPSPAEKGPSIKPTSLLIKTPDYG